MAYKPPDTKPIRPGRAELTARMVAIGMQFDAAPAEHSAIEETLVLASEEGMIDEDLRTLSVLVTWLGTHHAHVNADRLTKMVRGHDADRVQAFWSAVGVWLHKDKRLGRLAKLKGSRVNVTSIGVDLQIERLGEDPRFSGTRLRAHAKALRDRAADVLSPLALSKRHHGYRNRIIMGPSWRTDAWSELELQPHLTPTELARVVGCSFGTAWQAKQDFNLIHGQQSA